MNRIDYTPWIEKYRPSKLNDIILDDNIYKKIKKIIDDKDMTNLILPGVPGIGKTTTIKCIANELYGKYANEAVLELNASDDRGIKSVQEKIMTFCKKRLDLNEKGNYSNHKLIFLDEADNMTNKAQRLINNLMEKYHKTTRFVFTCNSSSDIIEGIQSKCIILRFYRISKEQIIYRLEKICEYEKIKIDKSILGVIADISDGDLRMAINNLQLVHRSCNVIDKDNVYKICSKPQPTTIKNIIDNCIKKDLITAKNNIFELKQIGYNESDIILGLIQMLKTDDTIDEHIRIKYLDTVCYYAYVISKGLATDIQLITCISNLI